MKRTIFILILIAALGITAISFGTSIPQTEVRLYFTESRIVAMSFCEPRS